MIGMVKGTMRETKTVAGLPSAIASFRTNASGVNLSSLKVLVEAVQSGSGTPSPDNVRPITGWSGANVTRTGKNLLRNRRTTATVAGITYTVNADGSVFIEGGQTASGTSIFSLVESTENYYTLPYLGLMYDTSYIMNGCPAGGGNSSYRLLFRSGGAASNKTDSGSGVEFNIASNSSTLVWCPCIVIASGYTIPSGGLLFKPMIRLASNTDSTFSPYLGNTYTIAFGDTYYGGELDVTNGVLRVLYEKYKLPSTGWVFSSNRYQKSDVLPVGEYYSDTNVMCDTYPKITLAQAGQGAKGVVMGYNSHYIYFYITDDFPTLSDWTTYLTNNDVYITRPLATPIEIQLTPQQIAQLAENNVFADTGDVEVTYLYKGTPNT